MSLAELLKIAENRSLQGWFDILKRHPEQTNAYQQSDAELVPLPNSEQLLALTVDTVAEEIALGFFTQPELIGWMGATVTLSDLAAVGARPIGLVISVTLPTKDTEAFQAGIARGLQAACDRAGTFVLGGDTNSDAIATITACGVGMLHKNQVMQRTGITVGDQLYITGGMGAGSAVAAQALLPIDKSIYCEADYRPQARVQEAQLIAQFASACMDTSDGLIATLDQLMRLNGLGFEISKPPLALLEPKTKTLIQNMQFPALLPLIGHHGEFELAFTIPEKKQTEFEQAMRDAHYEINHIGRSVPESQIRWAGQAPLDTQRIRNLLDQVSGDVTRYIMELTQIALTAQVD